MLEQYGLSLALVCAVILKVCAIPVVKASKTTPPMGGGFVFAAAAQWAVVA
jgi:hypothetical protein